jgi:hypothetical protein
MPMATHVSGDEPYSPRDLSAIGSRTGQERLREMLQERDQ